MGGHVCKEGKRGKKEKGKESEEDSDYDSSSTLRQSTGAAAKFTSSPTGLPTALRYERTCDVMDRPQIFSTVFNSTTSSPAINKSKR